MMAILSVVVAISIVFAVIGGVASPLSSLIGAVAAPAQEFFTGIGNSISDFFKKLQDADKLMLENASLNERINELNSDLFKTLQNFSNEKFRRVSALLKILSRNSRSVQSSTSS